MIDRDSPAYTARLDQTMAGLRNTVQRGGCVLVPVIDGDYAYTVGLTERNHPELVAHGAPSNYCAQFLEMLGDDVRTNGRIIEPPTVTFTVGDGTEHTLTVRPHGAADSDIVLGMVVGLYGPGRPALMIDVLSCRCNQCVEDARRGNV